MKDLNIFTCCDGIYKDFVPLFILSNIYHNNNCHVEVCVDNLSYDKIEDSIKILKKYYKENFILREIEFKKYDCPIIPNTIRFITEPKIKKKYIYISDVDIINLQKDISDIHIRNMIKTGLPYSNIVRPSKNRLSGLHFTTYENYYPIPDYEDLCKNRVLQHDEMFLFEIVKKKFPNFNYNETYRPVHGIHVSLNREPNAKLGWGMSPWKNQWIEFRNTKIFLELEPTLTNMIKEKIKIIDEYYSL